jgi:hypothetical protein
MSSQVLNKQRQNTDSLYANGASLGNGGLSSLGAVSANSLSASSGTLNLNNPSIVAPSTAAPSAQVNLVTSVGGGGTAGTPFVNLIMQQTNPNLLALATPLQAYATTAANAPSSANSYAVLRAGVPSAPINNTGAGTFTTNGTNNVDTAVAGWNSNCQVVVYGIVGTTNAGGLAAYNAAALAAPTVAASNTLATGFRVTATAANAGLIYAYQVLFA